MPDLLCSVILVGNSSAVCGSSIPHRFHEVSPWFQHASRCQVSVWSSRFTSKRVELDRHWSFTHLEKQQVTTAHYWPSSNFTQDRIKYTVYILKCATIIISQLDLWHISHCTSTFHMSITWTFISQNRFFITAGCFGIFFFNSYCYQAIAFSGEKWTKIHMHTEIVHALESSRGIARTWWLSQAPKANFFVGGGVGGACISRKCSI